MTEQGQEDRRESQNNTTLCAFDVLNCERLWRAQSMPEGLRVYQPHQLIQTVEPKQSSMM